MILKVYVIGISLNYFTQFLTYVIIYLLFWGIYSTLEPNCCNRKETLHSLLAVQATQFYVRGLDVSQRNAPWEFTSLLKFLCPQICTHVPLYHAYPSLGRTPAVSHQTMNMSEINRTFTSKTLDVFPLSNCPQVFPFLWSGLDCMDSGIHPTSPNFLPTLNRSTIEKSIGNALHGHTF